MTSSWQLEVKIKAKNISRPENESAEIWGFRYRLTPVIGTLKIMASTGVFVRVVFALKHSIENFPHNQA